MKRNFTRLILFASLVLCVPALSAQARKELWFRGIPNQVTVSYQYTWDDYQLELLNGPTEQIKLAGVSAEYDWNRLYPIQFAAVASFNAGQPESQKLETFDVSAGYTRKLGKRLNPYGRAGVGVAHTSSSDYQYLYSSSPTKMLFDFTAGIDMSLSKHFGVRPSSLELEYLPFGVDSHGSRYFIWGAGAFYRF